MITSRWPDSIIYMPMRRVATIGWDTDDGYARYDDFSYEDVIVFFREAESGLALERVPVEELASTPREGLIWVGRSLDEENEDAK